MRSILYSFSLALRVAAIPLEQSEGYALFTNSSATSIISASTSISSGPLPTGDQSSDNPKQCAIPSITVVPFDDGELHDHVDPNTMVVDTLDPNLWAVLAMDDWLEALITDCPALTEMGDGNASHNFPVALGQILIDTSEVLSCADMGGCTWSPVGLNFPGSDRPPKVYDLSDTSITNLRKWYALSAISEIYFYYQQMQDTFNLAKP